MKNIFSKVMLVAAAAMAFFACQKPEVIEPASSEEVMLTFSSEKPAFDDETKTEWTGETIRWSKGDKISVAYTVKGNWQGANGNADDNAKLYKSSELAGPADVANFNVSTDFKGTTEGTHVFYGVYPAPESVDFANAPVASLTIPVTPTPTPNTFDASGDLMIGVSEAYDSRPGSGETISLKWNRLVAHAVITLKEINGFIAGETLTGITLTAQEGANLVGKQNVDLTTGAVENNDGASNVIKIAPGNLSVDAKGTVTFWVCVLPETLTSLTVEVDTDQATYTREITGISKTFKQNARNTLAVNMSSATRVTKETESWVLVTPADGITEGTYALVASTSTKTGVLVSTNGSSSAPAFNTGITIEDNVLKGVAESMQFDIAGTAGNYEIYVAGGTSKWLYCTNTNNGVRVGTNTNKTWTISAHNKNINAFTFKHNTTNRYLGVYNNQDWRCYDALTKLDDVTGNTGAIYLYKKTSGPVAPDTTPKIIVIGETTKNVEFAGGAVTFNYNLKNLDGKELTWEVSDEEMISSVSAEDGVLTVTVAENGGEARTATITLSCGDADDVVLTLNQAEYVDASVIEEITVADFLGKSVDANVWYQLTGIITEIASSDWGNITIKDESASVYIYGLTKEKKTSNDKSFSSLGLKVGDQVTLVTVRGEYNGTAQGGGQTTPAYYVSYVPSCVAPTISCADNKVTIKAEDGATIYYTTNGNDPTEASTKYTAPFDIEETVTVKAIAVADGKLQSLVAEQSCTWVDPNAGGEESVVVLSEQFDNNSSSDSNNAITSSTFSNFSGATDKAYKSKYGGIKLGSSKAAGYITSKSLDLSSSFTVQLDACKYSSDTGNITVTVGSQTKTINNSQLPAAGTYTTFTLEFNAATASSTVKIATTAKRAYIDNVVITKN